MREKYRVKMKLRGLKVLITILVTSCISIAAVPVVPKKMDFAGIELTISSSARAEIQSSVNRLHKNAKFFQNYVDLADLYFPIIEREFQKNDVPTDIKYLCIQESGFKANAVSTSDAVGFWQFKAPTAREQGLVVDKHVDCRKNIVNSSFAASKYLKSHNTRFNDNWVYAIIAYNTGFGGAQKYWDSKLAGAKKMNITKKTHWYFLKFLAHKIAFQGFVQKDTPDKVLKVYEKTRGKTLKDYASQHRMPLEEVEKYNQWIHGHRKISSDKVCSVVIPISYEEFLKDEGDKESPYVVVDEGEDEVKHHGHEKKPNKALKIPDSHEKGDVAHNVTDNQTKNIRYKVNKVPAITAIHGDNSSKLAMKGGIVRSKFLKYNELKSFEELVPGQTYYLKRKKLKAKVEYHVVQYGETLWSIGQKYGMKKDAIKRKNRMSRTETPRPGRVLYMKSIMPENAVIEYREVEKPRGTEEETPTEQEESIDPVEEVKENTVEEGETTSTENNTSSETEGENAVPTANNIHYIQKSETLYSISRLHGLTVDELKKCNNMESDLLPASLKYLKICDKEEIENVIEVTPEVEIEEIKEVEPVIEEVEETTIGEEEVAPEVIEEKKIEEPTVPVKKEAKEEVTETIGEEDFIDEAIEEKMEIIERVSSEEKRDTVKIIEVEVEKKPEEVTPEVNEVEEIAEVETEEVKEVGPEQKVNLLDGREYVDILVEPGMTFYGLSKKYGASIDEIKEVNNITSLSAGYKIKVPLPLAEKDQNKVKYYTVVAGDTMYGISVKLKISVADLKKKNNKTDNSLAIGEVLKY